MKKIPLLVILLFSFYMQSCSYIPFVGPTSSVHPLKSVNVGYTENGLASWYGPQFQGQLTASGEIFDMYKLTAASRTLPLNVYTKVTNLDNNRSTVVKINDRGPFVQGRILDLSYEAAKQLGMLQAGVAPVRITVVSPNYYLLAANEKFTIQVGAFTDFKNAFDYRNYLSRYFDSVYINSFYTGKVTYYRVRVGIFDGQQQAQDYAQTIVSPLVKNYFIVAKD
ncbi:Rare lipoprotein A precursor [Desulfurella amilsii]|uniref:Probable endolytic peptidoglycan transglycosylase RlpA n=1 Tax=Desulfurella amilsii TaxID=1562698 RepID=A0A1X4XYH3_9BACT|nr:septal ring lytic transglycosylase RlpA family protein [Desulfurella amilsii]OSS42563.1 Rare lipoprotein A precursor [Desulfurella amilsii]